MPPLRSRRSARPSTDNRPDPPRRSALRAPTERKPASSASAGTGTVSSGGVLSAQTAPECPQEVPGGKGGTCRGRKRQKSACVPRSALAKAGALSWPSSAAAGAGCGQPPGGAERQPPALPARAQHCWASPQRVCEPARPAPSPARPGAGRLDGTRSCIGQRAEAQPSGFRAGGRLAKVVAKAFWAGMTRGKRTGGEQTAARSPMPAQPAGRRCTSSPAGKIGGAGAERPHGPGAERQIPALLPPGGSRDRAGAQPLNVTAPGISAL